MRYATADKIRMSAGIIGRNLAVLRELQSRFALDFYGVPRPLLPSMNFLGQALDGFTLAGVGIKIVPLVRIVPQVVELVLVFIAKTKLPPVRGDNCPSEFAKRLLALLFAGERGLLVDFFLARSPFDKDSLRRHCFTANQSGPAFSNTLRVRSFAEEIEHSRRKIDVTDRLHDARGTLLAGHSNEIWNAGRLIEHEPFTQETVRTHHVPMVAG